MLFTTPITLDRSVSFVSGSVTVKLSAKNFSRWLSISRTLARHKVEARTQRVERTNQMKYLLLIYQDEQSWDAISESERQQIYGDYRKLREQLQKTGQFVSGSQLQPIS